MAKIILRDLRPPYPGNRISLFEAEEDCLISGISYDVNANEPKKFEELIVFPRKDSTGNKNRKPEGKRFKMHKGEILYFILKDSPINVVDVTLHFSVTKPKAEK